MSASLKTIPGRQLRGMRQLKSKILDLQTQYQSLLKERQEDITTIIATLDLASLEDLLLIGGLLFIQEKVTENDSILEVWRDAGEKFLRRSKSRTPSCSRKKDEEETAIYSHSHGKQEEFFPQAPAEENASLKQAAQSQTTPQSPQKLSSERAK